MKLTTLSEEKSLIPDWSPSREDWLCNELRDSEGDLDTVCIEALRLLA